MLQMVAAAASLYPFSLCTLLKVLGNNDCHCCWIRGRAPMYTSWRRCISVCAFALSCLLPAPLTIPLAPPLVVPLTAQARAMHDASSFLPTRVPVYHTAFFPWDRGLTDRPTHICAHPNHWCLVGWCHRDHSNQPWPVLSR